MKKIISLALGLIIVLSLSACGSTTAATSTGETGKAEATESKAADTKAASTAETGKTEATKEDKAPEASAEGWSKVDQTVTVDGVDYTISAYKKTNKSEMFNAEDGKTFLLIDMTVKNKTSEESALSSIITFALTDADGKEYDISLGGFSCLEEEKIEQADGSVAASSEKRCGLAYEVPENAKGLKLSVKELLGDGKKTVDLY